MRVEISRVKQTVAVAQYKLVSGNYELAAHARTGERFTMTEPFEVSFEVTELLSP
jgi:hypothetical protein